ncbi:tail fiber domain-containing protein [Janthinobacterium sp. LB2P10]|uniref:tail fiber domain-containing protein n=1 Tax=Janthinobacterium sp. LB2P10 TaxID=3424194 RepID=UPI003F291B61
MNTVPRFAPATDRVLLLAATAQHFKVAATTIATPARIDFTAGFVNMEGQVAFAASNTSVLTRVGNVVSLTSGGMVGDSVTITASIVVDGLTYTASQTISKIYDGVTGNSSRVCYSKTSLSSLASAPATLSTEGATSYPPLNTWGAGTVWEGSPQEFTAGESLYRSDGIFNPASGTTLWSAPYLNALKVGRLSAISADIGEITAGTLRAVTIYGGPGYLTKDYAWPTNGLGGFHLSPAGLLIGNPAQGKYVQIDAAGNFYAPGFSIVDGSATFSGTLSAASGTIGLLQTSASGRRITLSSGSNLLKAYSASGDEVVTLGERTGGGAMQIDASGGQGLEAIRAIGGCFFNAGIGTVTIYSTSIIGLEIPKNTRAYNIVPGNSSANLGDSNGISTAWKNIYSQTAVTIISDERDKEEIQDSDLGLDFILSLRPVRYRMKIANTLFSKGAEIPGPYRPFADPVMHEEISTPVQGVRNHYGFIAQEVRKSLGNSDSAIWVQHDPSDPESQQALRYEELLAPIVSAVQQLNTTVQSLRTEVADLKQKLKASQ